MQTAWYHLQTGHGKQGDDDKEAQILANKLSAYQQLRQISGLTREQTVRLLRFIRYYTRFYSTQNIGKFDTVVLQDKENQKSMGILEAEREQYAAVAVEANKKSTIINLLRETQLTVEAIASALDLEVAYVESIKAELAAGSFK